MADEPKTDGTVVPATDDVLAQPPEVLPDAPVGGEVDEWGQQDFTVGFARIAGFPTEEEAAAVARHLVEAGIGATVSADPALAASDPDGVHGVHVLYEDRRRAAEILGLVEPEDRPEANPLEPIAVERPPIPWKVVLPIFAIALIVVPVVAGLLTYFVMSR